MLLDPSRELLARVPRRAAVLRTLNAADRSLSFRPMADQAPQRHENVSANHLDAETFRVQAPYLHQRRDALRFAIRRFAMKRFASTALALALLASPAVAQTKMDCSRLYKDFWEKFDQQKYAKISAEQLAGVSRMALRAYDACQAGDEQDAKALFDRLSKMTF
jgi:hypothetical protein